MRMDRARELLITACCHDFAESSWSYARHMQIARQGFVGFAQMSDEDLIEAVCGAGLQEDDDEVMEAIDTLEKKER